VVADALDKGCYGIVVGNGLLADALDAVGNATGFDKRLDVLGNETAVLADALDEGQIVGADLQGGLFGEDFLYLVYIIY